MPPRPDLRLPRHRVRRSDASPVRRGAARLYKRGVPATKLAIRTSHLKLFTTMPATVYLVSGSNRGIGEPVVSQALTSTMLMLSCVSGLALVKALVARPDVIVFAGTRKPAAAVELQALAKSNKDKVPRRQAHVCRRDRQPRSCRGDQEDRRSARRRHLQRRQVFGLESDV
jgi:hypothetical protein